MGYITDTIGASDTVYFYLGGTIATTASSAPRITENGSLGMVIVSDSISGATGATVTIEYCPDLTGTEWYTYATLAPLNGAAQQIQIATEDVIFLARKARMVVTAPGGAQATRLRFYYAFKASN